MYVAGYIAIPSQLVIFIESNQESDLPSFTSHLGVTTHSPHDLDFPSTMTNLRSGTWIMTGNGVMHNGTTVIDDYGLNLDKLKESDRVAVVRKEPGGTLHFFVNSEDQVRRTSSGNKNK